MTFSEKLDFLMNVTKTTNSSLALYTSLDASHISRLRRGERNLAKNENYAKAMAIYFYKYCIEDYQKKALMGALGKPVAIFGDHEKTTELLYRWLLGETLSEATVVEGFLSGLSNFQFKKRQDQEYGNGLIDLQVNETGTSVRYGLEGKREAVLSFLSLVLRTEEPQTLLLFSDEDMEWLAESREFASKWASMMSQVIMRGNRIKIIHTVSRNLDEMLEAIAKWIPLYMTGSIEPYYYPKKRDGIFKRTLFIAPKTAAVVATSVGTMADKAANFLLRGIEAVEAVTEEYNNYLAMCRPLMHIYAPRDRFEYIKMLNEFEKEKASAIIKTGALSLATMPTVVAESMIARTENDPKSDFIDYCRTRRQGLENNLRDHSFTEIVKIPDISRIKEGKVGIGFSGMFGSEDLFYTPDEFRLHIESIVELLLSYENYHVCIEKDAKEEGYVLYAKEECGAIVVKTLSPSAIFAINESNMTAAFWDFLKSKIDNCSLSKKNAIKELQAVIEELSAKNRMAL